MDFLHQASVFAADIATTQLRILHAVGKALVWTKRLCASAVVAALFFYLPASADTDYAESSPLTDSQWDMVHDRVGLLDKIAYRRATRQLSIHQPMATLDWIHRQSLSPQKTFSSAWLSYKTLADKSAAIEGSAEAATENRAKVRESPA